MSINGRMIAVLHRVKMTADGEARPTILLIRHKGGKIERLDLETEDDELDFLLARSGMKEIGLRMNDTVITILGGSGDALTYALSRHGEDIGATVYRIPGYHLKARRDECHQGRFPEIDLSHDDANGKILFSLADTDWQAFYHCGPRDREQMLVAITATSRREVQRERIKAGNRLRARAIGQAFYSKEGKYPEGKLEDAYEATKATDAVYQALLEEEKARTKELERAFKASFLHPLLSKVTGVGPAIAGEIIARIGDIRRFSTAPKLKAFAGVHVLGADGNKMPKGTNPASAGGKFARRRAGQRSNWNPDLRQALFQFGDQCNRRPSSEWGKKLLENKRVYREKHPHTELVVRDKSGVETAVYQLVPGAFEKNGKRYSLLDSSGETIEVTGTQRYFDGHIHKMALWRTISQFVEWLHAEWTRYDREVRTKDDEEQKAA